MSNVQMKSAMTEHKKKNEANGTETEGKKCSSHKKLRVQF